MEDCMANRQKKNTYTIVIKRKYSEDKVKAIDLFTRIISEKIIVSKHNLYAEKADLSKESYSDIESC